MTNERYITYLTEWLEDEDASLEDFEREVLTAALKALEELPKRRKEVKRWKAKALEQQKTGHWIPVSEGLPEENGFYLATLDGEICGENEPFTGLAEYENGKWVDDEEDYQCVLAWMPLPEPYKAESEDKE